MGRRSATYTTKIGYRMYHWEDFDYKCLAIVDKKKATKDSTYSDIIITADTETSKKTQHAEGGLPAGGDNHVVAWTISMRFNGFNLATLYGHRPSTFCECLIKLKEHLDGDKIIIFFHNLGYDWVFLRKYLIDRFKEPVDMLNLGAHEPNKIEFENGIILRDSLALAQRDLESWAKELDVEHKKAKGYWDYNKIRNQGCEFSKEELIYIEYDTLALAECLDKVMRNLGKSYYQLPFTATGIVRGELRQKARGVKKPSPHELAVKNSLTYKQYKKCEQVYHGGYSHGNRHFIEQTVKGDIVCYDFASSYPYCLLAYKYPMTAFVPVENKDPQWILDRAENYAFMFKLILINPRLKDPLFPMPALQASKCVNLINERKDNGRILECEYCEIYLNEIDLQVILEQYEYKKMLCVEVEMAKKDYLPRWLTDYIYSLFVNKTLLKGGDPALYMLAKIKLNSVYGMMVEKPVRDLNREDYELGSYYIEEQDEMTAYADKLKSYNTILCYQWGTWTTSYAFRNLFDLGKCCGEWLYSDTDSCYGIDWDEKKLNAYNEKCKELLRKNGYKEVITDKEYWLGVAELDKRYSEFRVLGAKRYCGRAEDGLHITVAGVPKSGSECLNNDINNFTKGFIFKGEITGKLLVNYIFTDDLYIDENGNETGDSIDLSPCDYKLDNANIDSWEKLEKIEYKLHKGVINCGTRRL